MRNSSPPPNCPIILTPNPNRSNPVYAYSYPQVQSNISLIRYRSPLSPPNQFAHPVSVPVDHLRHQSILSDPGTIRYEDVESVDVPSHLQNKIVTISSSNTEDDFEMVSFDDVYTYEKFTRHFCFLFFFFLKTVN